MPIRDQQKIMSEIVAKLQDPLLLFSIFFGVMLFSVGAYNLETIIVLRTPLVIVFVSGIIGTIFLKYLASKSSNDTYINQTDTNSCFNQLGLKEILPNRHVTSRALESVTPNTSKVKMLAISGLTSTLSSKVNEKFAPLKNAEIKFLMLSPISKYVEFRHKENPTRSLEGLVKHIESGLDLLLTTKMQNNLNNFEIKTYNEHSVFRIIIIDEVAYISHYPKGPADMAPVLVAEKGKSWLYGAFEKYFDSLWERSEHYKQLHNKSLELTARTPVR